MKKVLHFLLVLALVTLASCSDGGFKEDKVFLGKYVVKKDTLSLGKQVYVEYCSACHGLTGDGNGVASRGTVPPPRNFQQGLYKFGTVKEGGLPTDADFERIIMHGLNGTAMLKWDVKGNQIDAVIQYIKTFAPQVWEGKDKVAGEPINVTKDPFVGNVLHAINKGKEIYHITASCQSCHRAYATKSELNIMSKKLNDEGMDEFDDDMYVPKLQDSDYYFHDSKERTAKFLPPDFTFNEIRSVRTSKSGKVNVSDIYKRLVSGVTGTAMASWRDVITDEEIWATSYYIKSLMDIKDTPARAELMDKLKKQ
jgi:mono/diheme cytochrome c family protein